MCSCLLAFMEENFQGDLSDIVRAGGGGMAAADDDYYIFSEQFQPSDSNGFGDPFSSMRDPFLVELDGIDHPSFSACGNFEESLIGTTPFQISAASDKYNSNCNSSMNPEMVSASAFQPLPTCDLQGVSCDNGFMNHSLSPKPPPSTHRLQMCSPRNPITKRRKSQVKKVVCIPAANSRQGGGEVVPSDLWAWRKYGQKPIKGSPYPRGYYRCSSSKGCPARKQVERSRTDPNMLVITYTSEHNHPWPTQRNSLAGSTRIPFKPGSHKAVYMKEETDPDKVEETGDDRKGLNDVVSDDQLMLSQMPSDCSDLFSELRDLEADFFTQSMLDPCSSLFDWTSYSSANSTTNRSKHEDD